MFYRPHFCCHCGEKITRSNWTPLTSRRFCDFCEIEQKQHDLIPRVFVGLAILFGAAGIAAYVSSPSQTAPSKARELRSDTASRPVPVTRNSNSANSIVNEVVAASNTATSNTKQREVERNSSTEAVYYCGALTKKGTPCTRRVKAKGRCWQHVGQ